MTSRRPSETSRGADSPNRDGELVVFGGARCHLCDEAMEALSTLAPEVGWTVRYVAIDGDPVLEQAHRSEIPVGFLDGVKVFKYRVDPARLRRLAARRQRAEISTDT